MEAVASRRLWPVTVRRQPYEHPFPFGSLVCKFRRFCGLLVLCLGNVALYTCLLRFMIRVSVLTVVILERIK